MSSTLLQVHKMNQQLPEVKFKLKEDPKAHQDAGSENGGGELPVINKNNYAFLNMSELYDKALDLHLHEQLSEHELNRIAQALNEVSALLDSKNQGRFVVRQARLSDVDDLFDMVCYWARMGENLPRPKTDIIRNILTFAVCVKDNEVLGCACLYVYDSGLAEVRSLGVNPAIQRQGQGRAIVNFLIQRARQMEIKKVFALTRNPKFFAKIGFEPTTREALPEKILKDCENCPKKDHCDEHAYEMNL